MKNYRLVMFLLIIIVLILGSFCILFATNKIVFKSNDEVSNQKDNKQDDVLVNNNVYDYSEVSGLYKFESENLVDDSGNEYKETYNLYLYGNGTFVCKITGLVPFGYMGNYIIENDKIKLNYLFSFNSGANIKVITGDNVLTINTNGTLNGKIQSSDSNSKNIILTKTNAEEANDFLLNGNDFNKKLTSSDIEKYISQ